MKFEVGEKVTALHRSEGNGEVFASSPASIHKVLTYRPGTPLYGETNYVVRLEDPEMTYLAGERYRVLEPRDIQKR